MTGFLVVYERGSTKMRLISSLAQAQVIARWLSQKEDCNYSAEIFILQEGTEIDLEWSGAALAKNFY